MLRRTRIADQLRQRLYGGVHLGLLGPGQRLAGVRELAHEFEADPRVVMGAYRELESEGLVEIRPRVGIFVSVADAAQVHLRRRAADWMVDLLIDGREHGIPAPGLPQLMRQSLETVRLRIVCIECNHDQIASLTGELNADYGVDATGIDTFTLGASVAPPEAVRQADLLITTPFHVVEVEPVAAALAKPWIAVELTVDPFVDIARRLRREPVFFVVEDARFADKLARIYQGAPGASRLHPLVVGRDDLSAIPDGAATYVTRLAGERLGSARLPAQAIGEVRAFSRETSRQIFSFIVRANLAALGRAL